ncbi:MAG: PaaI family thioesterase [Desulfobacterales bacterium]|nr:PaaI family thioesterase [Deltaproteobacteria bacterium]NNL41751.1 PaaI family thioesterase [Desulfobacterales bacterium]
MGLSLKLKSDIITEINKIPIVDTLKIEIITLDDGYCETKVQRKLSYDGVFKSFHGGLLMTIADSTACFAIFTRTGPYVKLTTTDMNIRFLSPCLSDVTVKARVIKVGRTLSPVSIDLYDAAKKHVAVAQVNYILLDNLTTSNV